MKESDRLIRNEAEAIECLKSNKPTSGYVMLRESIDMAIKALEKQIPKKPIVEYKNTNDCITEIEWKCPICGTNYIELAPCGEWCNYCGQKLDWSDEE